MNNNPSRQQILEQWQKCKKANENITEQVISTGDENKKLQNEIRELEERLGQLQQLCQNEVTGIRSGYESQQKKALESISNLTKTLGEALTKYSRNSSVDSNNFGKLVNQGYKYGCVSEMNHFKKIYKNAHKNTPKKVKSKK